MTSSEPESTPSPEKKPSPVLKPSYKWETFDCQDLEQKMGLSSLEETGGKETRHPLGFQQTTIWGQFTKQPPTEHGCHSKSPSSPE